MRKLFLALFLAAIALPMLAGTALASDFYDDRIVFGDNVTLASGETVDGNLIVFGGNVTIEDGATVAESVVVFGGNVEVGGHVKEDVVTFGGNVNLLSTAQVDGRLVTSGGSVNREEGAVVSGGESNGLDGSIPDIPPFPDAPGPSVAFRIIDPIFTMFRHGIESMGMALALGLIALLVVAMWPTQTHRVSATITGTPALSAGLGLLTLFAGPVLIVLTAITLCLLPLSGIGALLYGMVILFGWLALGSVVGARLATAINWRNASPAMATAVGTLLLSLVMLFIGIVPFFGAVVQMLFASIGVGAVVLTRFGTRPYLTGAPIVEPAAQPAAPTPPAAPVVADTPPGATVITHTPDESAAPPAPEEPPPSQA